MGRLQHQQPPLHKALPLLLPSSECTQGIELAGRPEQPDLKLAVEHNAEVSS